MHRIRASFLIFIRFDISHRKWPLPGPSKKLHEADLRSPSIIEAFKLNPLRLKARKYTCQ